MYLAREVGRVMQERQAFAAQQVQMLAENIERDVPSIRKSGDPALKPNLLSVALQAGHLEGARRLTNEPFCRLQHRLA